MSQHPLIGQEIEQQGLIAQITDIQQSNIGRTQQTSFVYTLAQDITLEEDNETTSALIALITEGFRLIRNNEHNGETYRYSIRLHGRNIYTQTPFQNADSVLDTIRDLINRMAGTYNEDSEVLTSSFEIIYIPIVSNSIITQSGNYGVKMIGGDVYLSPGSYTNCGFICFALGLKCLTSLPDKYIKFLFDKEGLAELGKVYKSKKTNYGDVDACSKEMFTEMSDKERVRLRIYGTDLSNILLDTVKYPDKLIEMCYFGGHICLILRRHKLEGIEVEKEEILNKYYQEEIGEGSVKTTMPLLKMLQNMYNVDTYTPAMMEDFLCSANQAYPIKKISFPAKDQDKKIAAWDIETTNKDANGNKFDQRAYSCYFAYYTNELDPESTDPRTPYKYKGYWFKGFDCLRDMLKQMHQLKDELNGYTFYAHNGGKFDHQVIMQQGLFESKEWKVKDMQTRGGKIMKLVLVSRENGASIRLMDSLLLLSGALKGLLQDAGTQHQKLDFDHTVISTENCLTQPDLEKYQRNDVIGLLELMNIFSDIVWQELKLNITSCLTAASLAKKNFFQNYYKASKSYIFRLPRTIDHYIRNGYNGGRVEAGYLGHLKGKFYYYDVTSLYPSEMRNKMPCEAPRVFKGDDVDRQFFYNDNQGNRRIRPSVYGFARCKVTGPRPGVRPLHSLYSNNKLLFPMFEEPTEMVLFTEEMRYAMLHNLGYEYEVIDFVSFTPIPILKQTVENGFKLKAEQTAKGNSTAANTYKILINSTYGFFGLVVDALDSIKLYQKTDPIPIEERINAMLTEERYRSYLEFGEYNLLRGKFDLRVEDFNVAIAAAVTSYSRLCLYMIMTAFEKEGGKIYYCDTDSVITDINIKECPNVMAAFQRDGTGEELGMLKNEASAILSKKFKAFLDKEKEVEPEPSFDEICLLGCKNYALRRNPRYVGGPTIEILKMKGVDKNRPIHTMIKPEGESEEDRVVIIDPPRKLNFDDYILLAQGYTLKQNQEHFKAGYETMMDHEVRGGSRIVEVTKKLTMNYNKGKLVEWYRNDYSSKSVVYKVQPLVIAADEDSDGRLIHRGDRYKVDGIADFEIQPYPKSKNFKPTVKRVFEDAFGEDILNYDE